ncbi:unknown [Firmicutes bacterium CAG:822]|nr:unknown [Firmicutes bacterium CAG:822]
MENGLHTVVEFDENDKWFVLAEKIINGSKYSYLVRVNQNEDDFIDEYQVVKSYFDGNDEYMDVVNGDELKKVIPVLIPEAKEYIEHPEKLKQILSKTA